MKELLKNTLLVLMFIIASSFCYAQKTDDSFRATKYRTNEGLSHNYVACVVSDKFNVKWIGTEGGITKYNGKTFEYIKPGKNYPDLKNENIEKLFVDKDNNLWIGTKSGGISRLDIVSDSIQSFNKILVPNVTNGILVMSITQDSLGYIWVGTYSNGVYVFNAEGKGNLIRHIPAKTPVLEILLDSFGNIWFGESNFLIKYEHKDDTLTKFNVGRPITDIIEDRSRGKLWIATNGKEYSYLVKDYFEPHLDIDFFDFNTGKIDKIYTGVSSDYARYLALDIENRLLIGTWGNGIYRSNQDLTDFKKMRLFKDHQQDENIINQTVLDIHIDKNNIIWLSMAYGGVVKLTPESGFVNASQQVLPGENLPRDFNVQAIYNDGTNFWIGTSESGLLFGLDIPSLKILKETIDEKVYSIYRYEDYLFVGLEFSVKVYDVNTKKVKMTAQIKKATSFLVDKKKRLWIGTQLEGLVQVPLKKFNETNSYIVFNEGNNKIKQNRIGQIIYDDNIDKIWIGTYHGFYYFDETSKNLVHNDLFLEGKLPSVIINQMYFDEDKLWIATPNGLVKTYLKPDGDYSIESIYNKGNYLNNDYVCSITDDNYGNLWISTSSEIVKYNKSENLFSSYNELDGIETSSFNYRSVFKNNNGLLYFGGIDNITFFDPKTLYKPNLESQIILTDLQIDNQKVSTRETESGTFYVNKSVEYLEELTLSHKEKSIGLGFGLNDYLGELNAEYRYNLEGFQNDWLNVKNNSNLNFTGLPPGDYKLHIQGTRDGLTWSPSRTLNLSIKRHPFLSIWAYLLYAAILFLVIYFISRNRNKQQLLEKKLQLTTLEKENEVKLSASKLNFFTNISHEFRTPLTLIVGPLEELLAEKNITTSKLTKLETMQKSAARLLNLVNQLLDFRKADYGKLTLRVSEDNFVQFSNEVFLYFKELAKSKNIIYEFIASNDVIRFVFDRNQMEIVLCNLISNSFKNTENGGKITIKIFEKKRNLFISVSDTGKGINADEIDKIFNRFYQIKDTQSTNIIGSGIGLAFSKEIVELHQGKIEVISIIEKGTEFIVELPIDNLNDERQVIIEEPINSNLIDNYKMLTPRVLNNSIKNKDNAETILIVEDNEDVQNYIKAVLEEEYNILVASDGQEGYDIAVAEVPDIVLSDVMMPKKDGFELCKELKMNIITSHVPIIILTARTAAVYEIEGLQNGADAYVTKPFNPNIIKVRIKSILETRKKVRQHYQNKIQFGPNVNNEDVENSADNEFVTKLISFVEENLYNTDFGIDDLKNELFMSQSTLYRKLKSLTGFSPTAFIRSVRLKKAAELILTNNHKLNYVALEVGFNDYKYFMKSFQNQFNCLPSEYKKSLKDL